MAAHRLAVALGVGALAGMPAFGQTGGRSLALQPSFSAGLTASSIHDPVGGSSSDVTTRLSPGLSGQASFGRTRLSFAYTLNALRHSRQGGGSEIQNGLASSLSTELVENRLFVDASAAVSATALNAFGTQVAPESSIRNLNRTEVATLSVSPSIRGQIGSVATYEARLTGSAANVRRSKVGDTSSLMASISLNSASSRSILGWGLLASRQRSEFRVGAAATSDRASASFSLRPDTDLQFGLRGGRESNDVLTGQRSTTNTAGGSVSWTPSPRSSASFETEHRYFGRSQRFSLQYRTPLSVLRAGGGRDVSASGAPNGGVQPITLYQLLDTLLLSSIPDPVARDAAVQAALEGRDPNTAVSGGFVNSTRSLQDRAEVAWIYTGRRISLSLQSFRSLSKTLINGSFDGEPLRQHGYTSTASWRLSPTAALTMTGNRLMTFDTPSRAGTDLKSLSVGYTDQLTRLASANLSLRYSVFNSPTAPYREAGATAAVSLRF